MKNSPLAIFLKGSFISLIGTGILGILNYLVRRYLSIHLSPADYGTFYSILALLSMIFGFCDLGLVQSGTALIAQHSNSSQKNDYFLSLFFFKFLISVSIFIAICFFSDFLSKKYLHIHSSAPLILLSLVILFNGIDGSFKALWNGLKMFGTVQIFNILLGILLLLGTYVCVPKWHLYGAVTTFLIVAVFIPLTEALYGVQTKKLSFTLQIHKNIWKELLKLSGWLAVSTTLLGTVYYMDTVMLTFLKGVESAAHYNIALPIMQIVQSLMIFPSVFLPIAMNLAKEKKYRYLKTYAITAILITLFSAPIIYLFFHYNAAWLITTLFAEKYLSAAPAVPILCTALIFYTSGNFLFQILLCLKQTRKMAFIAFLAALCNIILNYILIQKLDFIGAALATLISYIIFMSSICLILFFHLRALTQTSIFHNLQGSYQ